MSIKSTNILENDLFKFVTIFIGDELTSVNLYIKHYELLGEQTFKDIQKLGYDPCDFDQDEVIYAWEEPILESSTCRTILEIKFDGNMNALRDKLFELFTFGE